MDRLVIIGASETAERIFLFCEYYKLFDILGFAVESKYKNSDTFLGKPVWNIEDLHKIIDKEKDFVYTALFWNHLNADRRKVYEKMQQMGFRFANIISPKASIRGKIGKNCWLMDYVVIQEGATIGDNVIIADNAFVGHKANISSHCFLGAKSITMGGAKIGEQSFIGIGASIFESVRIGTKSIVGACTVVKYNVSDFTMAKADISNTVIKQYTEDTIESKMIAKYRLKLLDSQK